MSCMFRVPEFVWADYQVLGHDFPVLARFPQERIDRWLVDNAAFVSKPQVEQAIVNSPIETDGISRKALRPPNYGRAVIAEVPGGLLDLKGAGVRPGRIPSSAEHSNGLEHLGVAFGDLMLKFLIDGIFDRASPRHWSVPIYAILDLGFDLKDDLDMHPAAGLQVRRAHRRKRGGNTLPESGTLEQIMQFEIEMTIRNYGLTSATWANSVSLEIKNGGATARIRDTRLTDVSQEDVALFHRLVAGAQEARLERINIQLSRDEPGASSGHLLDFGHFNVRDHFDFPITSSVADRRHCIGPILRPDDEAFIQPDRVVCLDPAFWNRPNLNGYCSQLVGQTRYDTVGQQFLHSRLFKPVQEVFSRWDQFDPYD